MQIKDRIYIGVLGCIIACARVVTAVGQPTANIQRNNELYTLLSQHKNAVSYNETKKTVCVFIDRSSVDTLIKDITHRNKRETCSVLQYTTNKGMVVTSKTIQDIAKILYHIVPKEVILNIEDATVNRTIESTKKGVAQVEGVKNVILRNIKCEEVAYVILRDLYFVDMLSLGFYYCEMDTMKPLTQIANENIKVVRVKESFTHNADKQDTQKMKIPCIDTLQVELYNIKSMPKIVLCLMNQTKIEIMCINAQVFTTMMLEAKDAACSDAQKAKNNYENIKVPKISVMSGITNTEMKGVPKEDIKNVKPQISTNLIQIMVEKGNTKMCELKDTIVHYTACFTGIEAQQVEYKIANSTNKNGNDYEVWHVVNKNRNTYATSVHALSIFYTPDSKEEVQKCQEIDKACCRLNPCCGSKSCKCCQSSTCGCCTGTQVPCCGDSKKDIAKGKKK